jgi:hydrogenase nickel incorporation protein HypB
MKKQINVVRNVLEANDAVAAENRRRLDASGVLAVNVTSAPGSGKTTLLEKTLPALAARDLPGGVVVGDLQTTRDAERLSSDNVQVTQINTGRGCHLDATQVTQGLGTIDLGDLDYLFIENVGNMVCPSGFDLGEHRRVAMLSVPEGDDKVAKYPTLFQPADVILLNKVDLAEALEFEVARVEEDLQKINTRAPFLRVSAKTGDGMDAWLNWLREQKTQPAG